MLMQDYQMQKPCSGFSGNRELSGFIYAPRIGSRCRHRFEIALPP